MSDEPNMHNVPVYPGGRPIDPKPLLAAIGDDLRVMVRQELETALTTHLAPLLRPTVILEQPARPEASSADGGTVGIEFGQATTYAESSVSPMRIAGVDANAAVDPQAGNGMPAPEVVGRHILDRLSILEAYRRNAEPEMARRERVIREQARRIEELTTQNEQLRETLGEALPLLKDYLADLDEQTAALLKAAGAEVTAATEDDRACPTCHLTGSHKLQCPKRQERQVVLPAEKDPE